MRLFWVMRNEWKPAFVFSFMTILCLRICVAFSWLTLSVCAYGQTPILPASSKPATNSPLWGDLQPGTYHTGFRTVLRYDDSRTWKSTRSYDGAFSPDLDGRPIQIDIWYPANVGQSDKKMRFVDYVDQDVQERFSKLNDIMRQRNRDDAGSSVPHSEITALQTMEMNAYRDAKPVPESFPAVLYFGGLNAPINLNAIMAEYLASHGYVVASISLIGPSDEQTFQSRTSDHF